MPLFPPRPTYTIVLTEYSDGTWSIEPVGMAQIPGYDPTRAGPSGTYLKGDDVAQLVTEEARSILAAALDVDRYVFDIRFCIPTGMEVARSTVLNSAPPGGGPEELHERIHVLPTFLDKLDDLDRAGTRS